MCSFLLCMYRCVFLLPAMSSNFVLGACIEFLAGQSCCLECLRSTNMRPWVAPRD